MLQIGMMCKGIKLIAVQCFGRVSEVVSEQSAEDCDCRIFLVSRTSRLSELGNRISGPSRSSREVLFGLTGGLSEVSVTVFRKAG